MEFYGIIIFYTNFYADICNNSTVASGFLSEWAKCGYFNECYCKRHQRGTMPLPVTILVPSCTYLVLHKNWPSKILVQFGCCPQDRPDGGGLTAGSSCLSLLVALSTGGSLLASLSPRQVGPSRPLFLLDRSPRSSGFLL